MCEKYRTLPIISGRPEHEIKYMETIWAKILQWISGANDDFPDYLRAYWNSFNPPSRKANLFKTISRAITTPENVFNTLRSLDEFAPVYVMLRGYGDDSAWSDEEGQYLRQLRMFNVRQPIPMLLASYSRFFQDNRNEFTGILKDIVSFSFRYNVIMRQAPNDLERMYNDIARGLNSGLINSRGDIKTRLKKLFPDDDEFKASFKRKTFNINNSHQKEIAKYILMRLERQASGQMFEEKAGTIEHVLPVNPDESWEHVPENQREELATRLGNLALLEPGLNRDLGNAGYDAKAPIYRQSGFKTTRLIPEHAEIWDQSAIESRQGKMAKMAASIWSIQ